MPRRHPAGKARAAHAKALDQVGLIPKLVGQPFSPLQRRLRRQHAAPRHPLVRQRDGDQDQPARDGQHPHPGMEDEDGKQEERRPGQVEEREEHRRGQHLPDRIQIAQRQCGGRVGGEKRAAAQRGAEDARLKHRLKPRREPRHHPRPDRVEQAHHREKEGHQHEKRQQRFFRPAAKHAIIDLKHEERPGQHQEVHEGRKQRDGPEQPALRRSGPAKLRPAADQLDLRHVRLPPAARFSANARDFRAL